MKHLEPSIRKRSRSAIRSALLPFLLAIPVLLALSGTLGGRNHRIDHATANAALGVNGPAYVRNGMVVEYELTVLAHRPMAKAAIEFGGDLWKRVTINTIFPAAEAESFEDGVMRLEFGPLVRGQMIAVKISGQINPEAVGTQSGSITLRDDETALATIPWHLWIWP